MVIYVRDLLTRNIKTVEAGQTLKIAARKMNNQGISSLVVVSNGKAVGLITERDIMRSFILNYVNLHKIPVKNFMSTDLITIKENAPVEEAIDLMIAHKIKKLLVISALEDKEKLIGILSMTDIVSQYPEIKSSGSEYDELGSELDNFPYLAIKE